MTTLLVNDSDFVEGKQGLPFEDTHVSQLKRHSLEQDCDVIALVRGEEIYLLKNRYGSVRRFVLANDLISESSIKES